MYILEFQRRSGDAMQFSKIYYKIYQDLLKNGFVIKNYNNNIDLNNLLNKNIDNFDGLKCLPLPDNFDKPILTNDDFQPLFDMVKSKYLEVNIEALIELANLAEDDSNVSRILGQNQEFVSIIINNLISTNNDILRVSCSIINTLINNNDLNLNNDLKHKLTILINTLINNHNTQKVIKKLSLEIKNKYL